MKLRWLNFKWWLWCKMFGEDSGFGPMHCDICGLTHYPGVYNGNGQRGWAECYYYRHDMEEY